MAENNDRPQLPDLPQRDPERLMVEELKSSGAALDELVKLMKTNMAKRVPSPSLPSKSGADGSDDDLLQRKPSGPTGMGGAVAEELAENTKGMLKSIIPSFGAMFESAATNSPGLRIAGSMIGGLTDFMTNASKRIEDMPEPEKAKEPEIPEPQSNDAEDYMTNQMGELVAVSKLQLKVMDGLHRIWDGDSHPTIKLMEDQLQQQDKLIRLAEEEAAHAENDRLNNLEKQSGGAQFVGPQPNQPSPELEQDDSMGWAGAILGGLTAGITSVAATVAPFVSKLKPLGKMLRVGPLALIAGLWDFGSGFLDAEEILGKERVTVVERVQAGLSNVLKGLGSMVDWAAGLFGMETEFGTTLQQGFISLTEPVVDFVHSVTSLISEAFTGDWKQRVSDKLSTVKDKISDSVVSAVDASSEALSSFFTGIWDGVLDKLIGMVDAVNIGGVGDGIIKKLEDAKSTSEVSVNRAQTEKQKLLNNQNAERVETNKSGGGGDVASVSANTNVSQKRVTNNNYTTSEIGTKNPSGFNYHGSNVLSGI